jgi:hypothetical protein
MTEDTTNTTVAGHTSRSDDGRPPMVKAVVRQLTLALAAGVLALSAAACGSADASPDDIHDIHSGKSKPTAISEPR